MSHQWPRQVPVEQPYYTYSTADNTWQAVKPEESTGKQPFGNDRFTVLSWNIDFMRPLPGPRMIAALQHLEEKFNQIHGPCVIFLQEMIAGDLALIQKQPWIQTSFNITDITSEFWESGYYGTCTLVSKLLPIMSVFRVHYESTAMERDALFVDINAGTQKSLRLGNTHLESLVANPPKRPKQLQTAAQFMHATQVQASVLGGDLNAIQDFDKTLPEENKLHDAYLSTGGLEDAETGKTWGQMALTSSRKRFGLTRMDKLLFCGNVQAEQFNTFGFGVEVAEDEDKQRLMMEGMEAGWVTDHLGVCAEFKLQGTAQLV